MSIDERYRAGPTGMFASSRADVSVAGGSVQMLPRAASTCTSNPDAGATAVNCSSALRSGHPTMGGMGTASAPLTETLTKQHHSRELVAR